MTVGSAFMVGVAGESDTALTRVMADAPEHAHKMAATADPDRKRERRSRRRSPVGRSLLPSAMFGEEQGTGDSLPAALDRRSHRRPPGGGGASGRPPKRSSTIAWHCDMPP